MASALASPEVNHVLVLDNGSETPFQAPQGDERVEVTRSPVNLGVAAGRNRLAASSAGADLICFLDSDAELRPGCVTQLAGVMSSDPNIAIAGPVFDRGNAEQTAGLEPSALRKIARGLGLTSRYRYPGPFVDGVREVEFLIGACQMVRRVAFEEAGGYDDSIFFGPEDLDLCVRLRKKGWRVVQVAPALATHEPRRSHRNLLTRKGRRHARAVLRYYWLQRATGGSPKAQGT